MKVAVALFVVLVFATVDARFRVGGLGKLKHATPAVQALAEELRSDLAGESGMINGFPEFTVISFRTQLVSGTNYFVKIKVDSDSYIHARLYVVPWSHIKEVTSVQINKSLDDPIEYF